MDVSFIVLAVVITALVFDFTNGFHDTANAMATSIATGALKPRVAVAISAVLNLCGAFLSTAVAKTISGGLVDDTKITPAVIFGGLVAAIVWNMLTWLVGLPSSSSHALFGGLIGAVWIAAGADAVHFSVLVSKILLPALTSPVLAGVVALIGTYLVYKMTHSAAKKSVDAGFRFGQTISASVVSLAHGTSDGQKTMGIITLLLITSGHLSPGSGPPLWVITACAVVLATGTYLGGWRIIRTMGHGLAEIEPPQGFAAETTSSVVLLTSAHMGFPLSTTQVCTGSILGAGLGRKLAQVRWTVARRMVLAWAFTVPAAATLGGLSGRVADSGNGGVAVVCGALVVAVLAIYTISRRDVVSAANVNHPVHRLPALTV
ncbi:inorganic phosphate transporter [Antrihabitans sp. YC2-6]|uniref:inorganic phosphate transporter n=1 Tax=Antrihabitans sp. YC2-6 TaxID=2799498 RepID=UPI0018F31763|nr:inorganic phosphate transporter [Antrihabitans sp. YC2-6]MBJ8347025.1 inorganic phosphate transporter [Antrihabitans sp. YC2-6]